MVLQRLPDKNFCARWTLRNKKLVSVFMHKSVIWCSGGAFATRRIKEVMTEHQRGMVIALCARISEEKNPLVFRRLLFELDAVLQTLNKSPGTRTEPEGENMSN